NTSFSRDWSSDVCSSDLAHGLDVRCHLWRLSDDGGVDIPHLPALGLNQLEHMAQQHPAIGALELRIGVRKVLADIAQRHRAEQCIAERMQQHVAIGMRQQAALMWNPHAAERDEVALAEAMHVVTVADTHSQNTRKRPAADSTGPVTAWLIGTMRHRHRQ